MHSDAAKTSLYVPAPQSEQLERPVVSAYVLIPHAVQALTAPVLYNPATQFPHLNAPVVATNMPEVHLLHEALPTVAVK